VDEERLHDAAAFLREAVFRSRARQAAGIALKGGDLNAEATGPANCGLGEKAALELDLSDEGGRLFTALWPATPGEEGLVRIQAVMKDWIVRQDALDRTRNHFLRDFRQEHGFDRRTYSPEQTRAFEEGLADINARVEAELHEHARRLGDPA
jgi:hypothetical protein